jgi:hypothetical protein
MTDEPRSDEMGSTPDEADHIEEFAHSKEAGSPARTTPVPPPEPPEPAVEDAAAANDDASPSTDVLDAPPAPAPASEAVATSAPKDVTPPAAPPAVTLLAIATAVLFVTTVLFGLMAFAPRLAPIKSGPAKLALKAQEEDGLKTIAKRFATNFVSIDYKTIDNDLKQMKADATNAFGEKLQRTIDVIGKQFKQRKASSSGRALDAAVLSHSDDSAIVQVLLRRTKRNVGTSGPETGNQVVNVTLVKTDDGWKVDDLSQLGAEGGQ